MNVIGQRKQSFTQIIKISNNLKFFNHFPSVSINSLCVKELKYEEYRILKRQDILIKQTLVQKKIILPCNMLHKFLIRRLKIVHNIIFNN